MVVKYIAGLVCAERPHPGRPGPKWNRSHLIGSDNAVLLLSARNDFVLVSEPLTCQKIRSPNGKLEKDKQKRTNGQHLAFLEVFKWIAIVPMARAKRRVRRLPLRPRPPDLSLPPGRLRVDTILCNP
jgi:hypothetical protein